MVWLQEVLCLGTACKYPLRKGFKCSCMDAQFHDIYQELSCCVCHRVRSDRGNSVVRVWVADVVACVAVVQPGQKLVGDSKGCIVRKLVSPVRVA